MSARSVLLRCDGGAIQNVGTGHVARCLLVADVLRGRGVEVAFAGRFDSAVAERIEAAGYRVHTAAADERETDLLARAIAEETPDVLVLDRLDTQRADIEPIRDSVPVLITVDDVGDGAELADMVVNAIVRGGDAPYDDYEYVVIRPPAAKNADPGSRERPRIVMSFGGYDHRQFAGQIGAALTGRVDAEILWLARASDPPAGPIPDGVTRIDDAPDFPELLAGADVAVVAGGLTLFEALANGVPAVAVAQYPHQADTIARLAEQRAVVAVTGDDGEVATAAADAVAELLAQPGRRHELHSRAMAAVDGRGLHRFADLVTVFAQLTWDTDYFGFPIARIYPLRLTDRILSLALREADELGIECTYYLCDCHHPESVRLAEAAGFHFVDIRLTFERAVEQEPAAADPAVREATADDLEELLPIARGAYGYSRYFFDHRFPLEQCERFYSDWLEKSVRGELGTAVFVIDEGDGPLGYIALDHDTVLTASISLVGVGDRARGRGVGQRLVRHALTWAATEGYGRVEVVTQGRNYEAQRLYQRAGFITKKNELWYHRWA